MVLNPLPFQCFDKYDRDYSTDDKTCQTSAQFFARKHFSLVSRLKELFGKDVANKASVNYCPASAESE